MASLYQSLASRSRQTAARVWQPRNTSSVILSKGLLNAPGENNCFLNSAVQVLWHLDVFRRSFREMGGHACMGKACIFCALKVLFTQLRYSERQSLPPDALRKALAVAFQDEHRFQLGCMDDAAECFENILTRIHFHLAHDIKEDLCDAKYCISHRKFAMTLIEHSVCTCGATSEPFPFTQMVHYVSCTALCTEAKKLRERHRWSNSVCFGQVLRSAGAIGDVRDCPSECGKKINIRRVLMNCPDVVAIGLVWDSDRPEKEHIVDVIECLGTSLRMPDLFNSVVDDKAKQAALHLVGVVTYYGKHYSTFFYNTALRLWVYFDDATVKQVGPNWRDVVNRCKRGHSQPLLLLFANPEGTPVPTDLAPKESTLLPGYTNIKSPTAVNPSRSRFAFDDPTGSSNAVKYQTLQPVLEYEPQHEIPQKSSPGRKALERNRESYVVEIGHDALQKIPTRYNGGRSTSENMSHRSPDKYKNSGHTRQTNLPTGAGVPNQKMYGNSVSSLLDDPKNGALYSRGSDETFSNTSPVSSRGVPASDLVASCSVDSSEPINTNSSDLHHLTANSDQLPPPHPRRLERHESWSGRPSHTSAHTPAGSQHRRPADSKYSVHRHHSFNHGAVPNTQQSTVRNGTQGLPQDTSRPNRLGDSVPRHDMSRSQMSDYPTKPAMSPFGSVPNLHRGFDLKTGKSVSVQNVALAEEGILASAIKNRVQQKRASTSDVSAYTGNHGNDWYSQQVTGGGVSGLDLRDLPSDQPSHAVIGVGTEVKKQNVASTQPSRYSWQDPSKMPVQRAGTDSGKGVGSLGRSTSCHELQQTECFNGDPVTDHKSFNQKTNARPPHQHTNNYSLALGYSLHDRDSVASRDSGYRSTDRSSSGSAYSIETPGGSSSYTEGTSDKLKEQTQAYEYQAEESRRALSETQDADALCDEVCAECADLEAQSRLKGDAGDLATALALCTAAVTKLKGCMSLEGLSMHKRRLLHSRYNTAVLHSRNIHRSLKLLRSIDSIPACNDQPIRSSQPAQPAREPNLITLQGRTDEFNQVDRLKQQLNELYMQDRAAKERNLHSAHQQNNLQAPSVGPQRTANTTLHSQTFLPTSGSQQAAHVFAHDQTTFQERPASQDIYRRTTSSNRNQNASSESYTGWVPDSSRHLNPDWTRTNQGILEDPRRSSMSQQGTNAVHVDPRRNSMTATMTPAQDRHDLTRQIGKPEPALHSTYV